MRKNVGKKILAFFLAGTLALGALNMPMTAEAGETVLGNPETIQTSQNTWGRNSNFNEGWKFQLGTSSTAHNQNFDDSKWKVVDVPHDFSISQNFTSSGEAESGFLPGGTGWYRKAFTLPQSCEGKSIIINFDGVYSEAYVYVNGTYLGENNYGYNAFSFDISKNVVCDGVTENLIAVKVVNQVPTSRWYSGSGIYRDVTLSVVDKVHVDLNGTRISTPHLETEKGGTVNMTVETTVANEGSEAKEIVLVHTIYEKGTKNSIGTVTTTAQSVAAGVKKEITATLPASNPKLWGVGKENAHLYTVVTEVKVGTDVVDTYETEYGFRYFSFDGSYGFKLNGENLKLNGVCMHHDQGALGAAAYYDAIYRQMSIMQDMGVNAIRVTHNPSAKNLVEICNELGILVIQEFFDGWTYAKNYNDFDFARFFNVALKDSNKILRTEGDMTWSEFVVHSVVQRDRNAPAVILWSVGNEISEGGNADSNYDTIAQNIIDWTNEDDGTRPLTVGSNRRTLDTTQMNQAGYMAKVNQKIADNDGIVGYNYASSSELDTLSNHFGVILNSETSSAVNSRGIYKSQSSASNADGKYHLTSYDTSSVTWGITAHDSIWNTYTKDKVAGEFVWTGFDYIGEPTPWNGTQSGDSGRGAIPNSSYFGIVETTGFEKDTYYLYRSQWDKEENTLHLVTAWDSDNYMLTNGKTPVWIYSNAPYVELLRNGTVIGTATRTVNRTAAGYVYYTYTTESRNSDVCQAVSASGADSLYASFNVAYEAGTISAVAYQEDHTTPLADCVGKASVSTPGTVSKLSVSANTTTVDADGNSLVYVTVDVLDGNNVLDTTAVNNISFTVEGEGVIVGVDNGDQATVKKYQQSSVLTGEKTANINAYAGKALVIVKSTKEAGNITINASAAGLSGGSVMVTSSEIGGSSVADNELASYTLVRDYSVKVGTVPELATDATGVLGDGTSVNGTIAWETVTSEMYNKSGDYVITGTLTFEGLKAIPVSCKLHVIEDVVVMRNISTATAPNTLPVLPDKVAGVLIDATVAGEFSVEWETMAESQFAAVGDIVEIDGVATVFGTETMPVKAFVRVAEVLNVNSTNVAPQARLSEDVAATSDNLNSINNGVRNPSGDSTNDRWTNWNNRQTSDSAAITLTWDTAVVISDINVFYRYDNTCKKPATVKFEYSLNGQDYVEIGATELDLDVTVNNGDAFTYKLDEPISPIAIKITLTQQSGKCLGLYEVETMTFAGAVSSNSSADLTGIIVDNHKIEITDPDILNYEYGQGMAVTATSAENVAVTVLPSVGGRVQLLTLSEDGKTSKVYSVTVSAKETPVVLVSAHTTEQGQITVTGQFEDYANKDNYSTVTNRGLLFYETVRLGSKALTVNTEGRTKINFTAYYEETDGEHEVGSFWYHKTPATTSMKYTVRAFLEYVDESGKKKYVYSEPMIVSYDLLKELEAEATVPTE